jgi:uncharacterized membrane protein YdbT with pleckstrin-like domain
MMQLLETSEQTILVVRKHWFVLFRDILLLLITYLLPIALYAVFVNAPQLSPSYTLPTFSLPTDLLFFLFTAWTFLAWIRLFSIWTDYYLDSWTLTNKRIIDVEQQGYFSRTVGSFRIEKIQDVTIAMQGILQSLLNFGDIRVETAGGDILTFTMKEIADPKRVKDLINKEVDRVVEAQKSHNHL